jgi:hypothetical protein
MEALFNDPSLQTQISAIVESYGESMLNDKGVDKKVCDQAAAEVMRLLRSRVNVKCGACGTTTAQAPDGGTPVHRKRDGSLCHGVVTPPAPPPPDKNPNPPVPPPGREVD